MIKDPDKNESDEPVEIYPDWSQMDAMSIYRSSGGTPVKAKQQDLGIVEKKNISFFKIFISFLVIICLIAFISGR
ncbi:MAG: hypothetical protein H7177_06555 [Rhizobacter sp.]|nr:hypothetical protein [Bacteriovorax sp.]